MRNLFLQNIITHAQWGAWVIKWAPFLRFGVTFVHANLCSHTFTTRLLGWDGGRRLFEIFSSGCKNCFVVSGKWIERLKKKQYSLKVPMKWNFWPLFYSRKLKSVLHWFIIFEFKLCSGAQNNFSIPPKVPKNAIVVFWGLELVTS